MKHVIVLLLATAFASASVALPTSPAFAQQGKAQDRGGLLDRLKSDICKVRPDACGK